MPAKKIQRIEGRTRLNRDRVLETAIRLADEGGIEKLSMRRLGEELGVESDVAL